ncbi:redoxin domain-containing protein [Paracnuella aquatica]|uniref:redoxin domain-containing protein n=1 Tax=Paracnuella aquatica TaxID=2268757 RepID=UPI000DF01635|nr:redoxin domain-containing protein [Paracnuella aquatica]RPD45558.1 hypothetical protein DRJ53_15245 [Paracnuella aquatica]
MRVIKTVIFALVLLLAALPSGAQQWTKESLSFATIGRMDLWNTSGGKAHINGAEKKLLLLVLMSPECPLCKNYSLVLNNLNQEYGAQVQVLGIVPGKAYTGDTLQQFAKEYQINFPLLIDADMRLSQYMQATVTPEVVLADSTGAIVYRGAIDDWVIGLGKKKQVAQQHYLADAINQYLDGQPVAIRSTIAKGCLINEF